MNVLAQCQRKGVHTAGAGDADADGPASKRLRMSGEGTTASRPPAEAADMPTRQRVVAKLAEVSKSGVYIPSAMPGSQVTTLDLRLLDRSILN